MARFKHIHHSEHVPLAFEEIDCRSAAKLTDDQGLGAGSWLVKPSPVGLTHVSGFYLALKIMNGKGPQTVC